MNTDRVDVAEIRRRHPIDDVISANGIELRSTGRSFTGCCPFHDDSTPSMSVGGVTDRFHCFGCGASGDVIDFVSRLHAVGFREAVDLLEVAHPPVIGAVRVSVPKPDRVTPLNQERAFEINALAWEHFTRPVAHEYAAAWLRRFRGIDITGLEAASGRQAVGHTGSEWRTLLNRLSSRGVREVELIAADLVQTTRTGSLIDTFRGRLVVPVRRGDDQITGFIGRATTNDPRSPKYRTHTRTAVHHPFEALYIPNSATEGSTAIVVEGPLDALAIASVAATAGRNLTAYATGGTQPTQGQANRLLAGQHDRIVFALDGDQAGHEGTVRWVDLVCRHAGRSANVADLPPGVDPADLVRDLGVAALDRLTTGRTPAAELAEIADRVRARDLWTPRQPVAGIAI